MSSKGENEQQIHVAMFPFFAFGHISPFVQLSNKLSSKGVKISFFTAAGNAERIKKMLHLTSTTQIISLTLPHVDGLPPGIESTADTTPAHAELLKVALDLLQPQIKTILSQLHPNFVLFDFAQDWLPSLASELGIKTIFYSVFAAISTAVVMPGRLHYPPKTTPTVNEVKILPDGFPKESCIQSLTTHEAEDYLYVFKSFNGCPSVFDRLRTGFMGCSAILIKTCKEMEGIYLDYIQAHLKKPILLVGPVVPPPPSGELDVKWEKWLSKYPSKSVIFCSFGSETFLKDDQIRELALGLELTGQPFLLVLNFPANLDSTTELKRTLPEGFTERVKDKGIVHTGWVQQQHILAHDSVGCFLCHAGFSSIVEGIVNDCQLVFLPLKGDQYMNSKLVSLDLKAGVAVNRSDEDGYFGKEDICNAVKKVMVEVDEEPGKTIIANQKKWKEFLKNDEIQSKFITDLVEDMKAISGEKM
uniref:Glycosyltransferase n=1 Tax=Lobelia erinus TaxID=16430 RepID=A0A140KFJ2_LOBER|nr:UDP-rhamnose:delphinidin 3-O-glucoside rhamnosyltransferase [Lobelia erinus]